MQEKYEASVNVTADNNVRTFTTAGGFTGSYCGQTSIKLELILNHISFGTLVNDIRGICEEELLRKEHPALQQAYEEYKILLKLIK